MQKEAVRKVTANFTWLLFDRILLMIVTMLVGIYLVRYLGPEDYGSLSFAISFVALFTALANLGLPSIMVKELVNHRSRHDELMGTSFTLKLTGSLVLLVVTFITAAFMDIDAETRIMISVIAGGMVFRSFETINFYFQSEVLSKYEAIARTGSLLMISAIKIILIITASPLLYFAVVYMLESLFAAILLVYFYQKKTGRLFHWKLNKKASLGLLTDCWPLIISGLVVSIHMKIDQVMINQMIGSKQVGFYAAAARLSEIWYFLPTIISTSVFPGILKAKKSSEMLYRKYMQSLYDFVLILALSLAIPITFLSDWIAVTLYGSEFVVTGKVLAIHIWSGVFVFMGIVRGKWSVIEGQQKYNPIIQGVGALLNVTLNYFWIPEYGVMGAAYATLATVFANLLVTPTLINAKHREHGILVFRSLNILQLIPRTILQLKQILSVKQTVK